MLRNLTVGAIMAFIVVLLIFPIITAIWGSLHDWNPLNGKFDWIGTDNYIELFADPVLAQTTINTVLFVTCSIVGRVVLGLAIAYALFSRLTRFKSFFRVVFYMPTITATVAVAYVWKLMYNPQFGVINSIFGLDINWLFDPHYAMFAIIAMTIWKDFGFAVILLLAGMYSLPEDALEAAEVDGANAWQKFWYVTLPLLRPMLFFVVLTSMIGYLQSFVSILVLTEGGPGRSTEIISYTIFDEAFANYNFGYASAIAVLLLVVTAVLTALSWRFNQSGQASEKRRRQRRRDRKEVGA